MGSLPLVRAERLELSHLAALDPKSSVSTNSTTPALKNLLYELFLGFTLSPACLPVGRQVYQFHHARSSIHSFTIIFRKRIANIK